MEMSFQNILTTTSTLSYGRIPNMVQVPELRDFGRSGWFHECLRTSRSEACVGRRWATHGK